MWAMFGCTVFVGYAASFGAVDVADWSEGEVAQLEDGGHDPENVGDVFGRESHGFQRFLLSGYAKRKNKHELAHFFPQRNRRKKKRSDTFDMYIMTLPSC